MKKELDKQLCEKYPKIFRDRNASMQESCMYWGFECNGGWYNIIDTLCEACEGLYSTGVALDGSDVAGNDGNAFLQIAPPQFIATQVKEKFGTLRFYYRLEFDAKLNTLENTGRYPEITEVKNNYRNYIDGIVHYAEVLSARTCEYSGKPGELHVSGGHRGGWYRTLNIEEAKTNPELAEREYVPVRNIPKHEYCIKE
jgi:hypothetical protein